MADKKISALTGASTPLAGTEVLPIVQSGATVKISVADLTVGRSVQMADFLKITGSLTPVMVGASTSVGQLVVNRNPVTGVFDDTSKAACYINLHSEVGASYMGFYTTTANNTNPTLRWTLGSSGNLAPANGLGIDFSATPGTGTSELLADYEEGTWTPVDSSGAGLTFTGVSATYTKVGRLVNCQAAFTFPATASAAQILIGGLPFSATGVGSIGVSGFSTSGFQIFLRQNSPTTLLAVNNSNVAVTNINMSGSTVLIGFSYPT